MMTDKASTTKMPPTTRRRSSFFETMATKPNVPPKGREPTSPINTWAGWALNQRKPRRAPTTAPQKTVSSPEIPEPARKQKSPNVKKAVTEVPAASPSNQSVRLTALLEPTKTNIPKSKYPQPKSTKVSLKNGITKRVS